jgi:hypothetical protein
MDGGESTASVSAFFHCFECFFLYGLQKLGLGYCFSERILILSRLVLGDFPAFEGSTPVVDQHGSFGPQEGAYIVTFGLASVVATVDGVLSIFVSSRRHIPSLFLRRRNPPLKTIHHLQPLQNAATNLLIIALYHQLLLLLFPLN